MHFGTGRLPWSPYLAYDVVVASVAKGKKLTPPGWKVWHRQDVTHQPIKVKVCGERWLLTEATSNGKPQIWHFGFQQNLSLGHLVIWSLGDLVNGLFKHAPFCNLWPMTTGTAITITMINDQLHIQISTNTCAIHTLGSTLLKGPVHIFGDVES